MYYTKYRPQKFEDVLKPNEAVDALLSQIKKGKAVHAYLFTGPKGTGKTTVARILAKALNCENITSEGDICGVCDSCQAIAKGSFLDLLEIDAASNRGIDDIRELKERIRLLPSAGKKKVYIIDEVHMLTSEAFNALLKTLEEPPAHATFILCTTESHKVPETIRSRCQIFKFKRPTKEQLVEKLSRIAKSETCELSVSDLEKIAISSGGAFRDAETMLQQFVEGDYKGMMFQSGSSAYLDFAKHLAVNDVRGAITLINSAYSDGVDLNVWLEGLLRYFRDLMYVKMGFSSDYFSITNEEYSSLSVLAESLSILAISDYIEFFNKAMNDLRNYSIPILALEVAIVKVVKNPTSETYISTLPEKTKAPSSGKGLSREASGDISGSSSDKPDEGNGGDKTPPKAQEAASSNNTDKHKHKLNHKDLDKDTHGKMEVNEGSDGCGVSSFVNTASDPSLEGADKEFQVSESLAISISEVTEKWRDVTSELQRKNGSVSALVKTCKPVDTKGSSIIVEVSYKFHKERLESSLNRIMIEEALRSVYGKKLTIKCIVIPKEVSKETQDSENLTDLNLRVPQNVSIDTNASVGDIFDGGLPI